MQIHELKKEYKTKKSKRIGRGGKRGTYSGKGQKGQKSRAGANIRPAVYDLIIKIPKKRGIKNKSIKKEYISLINLDIIEKNYHDGEIVSPQTLLQKDLIRKKSGVMPIIKILGRGNLTKKVTFKKCLFSNQALTKLKNENKNSLEKIKTSRQNFSSKSNKINKPKKSISRNISAKTTTPSKTLKTTETKVAKNKK